MPKAIDVAYVVYQVNDLDRMESFMQDFGLVTAEKRSDALFMRGASPAPFIHKTIKGDENRFVGGAMQMASRADLEALTTLPGSSAVEPITDQPGGGWRVRMHTPDGVPLDGVWADACSGPAAACAQRLQRRYGQDTREQLPAPQT